MRRLLMLLLSFALLTQLAFGQQDRDDDQDSQREFGGYDCTDDCSGHVAGYNWAEKHSIVNSTDCPYGNSLSFNEGCKVYAEDPSRGADQDDNGKDLD